MSAAAARAVGIQTGSTRTSDSGAQTPNNRPRIFRKQSGGTQTEGGGSSARSGPVAATVAPIYMHHPIYIRHPISTVFNNTRTSGTTPSTQDGV